MNILLADNDRDFLQTRAAYLEEAGYTVLKAYSRLEAEELLRHAHIHLAILDVRLEDDDDERDSSGLSLAENREFSLIPKLILTGYESLNGALRVLVQQADGVTPAVNYLIKTVGPDKMIQEVREALRLHVHTNENLLIHTDARPPLNLAYLSSLIPLDLEQDEPDAGRIEDRTAELKDLLGRLFYEYEQVTLHRVLWQPDARVALAVTVFPPAGRKQQFMVICGPCAVMVQSTNRFREFAPPLVLAETANTIRSAETVHFGAQALEVTGCDLEDVRSFDALYGKSQTRQIQQFVDNLYGQQLKAWHSQAQIWGPVVNIGQLLNDAVPGVTTEALSTLESHLSAIGQEGQAEGLGALELVGDQIRVVIPKQAPESYPHPGLCLQHPPQVLSDVSVLYGSIVLGPGADAIQVSCDGRIWLTDLAELGFGPLLSDYAALESEVKFELAESVELGERIEMEKVLMAAPRLSDRLSAGALPQPLEKALAVIRRIRQAAATHCGADIRPYHVCLLAHALRRLIAYEPGVRHTQREVAALLHLCTSIGLLCRCLPAHIAFAATSVAAVERGFRIDARDHRVFVDGSPVAVTPNEFSFLNYLWQRPGQLCDRTTIAKAVYGSAGADEGTIEGKLNMLVNRLRPKIELDPDEPKYLITRRGEGYSLYPTGS